MRKRKYAELECLDKAVLVKHIEQQHAKLHAHDERCKGRTRLQQFRLSKRSRARRLARMQLEAEALQKKTHRKDKFKQMTPFGGVSLQF